MVNLENWSYKDLQSNRSGRCVDNEDKGPRVIRCTNTESRDLANSFSFIDIVLLFLNYINCITFYCVFFWYFWEVVIHLFAKGF